MRVDLNFLPTPLRTADVEVREGGTLTLLVGTYIDKDNVRKCAVTDFSSGGPSL